LCIKEICSSKVSYLWYALALILMIVGTTYGEEGECRFQLKSSANQCVYEIEVVMPAGDKPSDTRFPVVYCMDWFMLGDYYEALPKLMAMGRLAEPYILVGITEGTKASDWAAMRTRDYTPAPPTDEYSKSNMYQAALETAGGADAFAAFLKNELIPKIESEYPADSTRRCFAGDSLGGLFGVYLLRSDPALFQYYLLGSPSLWYNEYYLTDELVSQSSDKFDMIKKIYLSVGDEESWEMLKSYDLLRSALHKLDIEQWKLKFEIIGSSGHVGAMPISLYNGLRFIFGTKGN
jgi:uncharacterized protein